MALIHSESHRIEAQSAPKRGGIEAKIGSRAGFFSALRRWLRAGLRREEESLSFANPALSPQRASAPRERAGLTSQRA
jgi:hypothetical protein